MFRPERLTEQRKKNKLTQEQLATRVNLTKSAISNYEQGRSAPPHETLVAIVDVLHTNSDYLLGISDNPASLSLDNSREHASINMPEHDFHFYNADGVQFIARSSKNLTPQAYQKMQELAKRAKELFNIQGDD